MNLLQLTLVSALLCGGLGVAVLGSVKVWLAARLQIDEARIGGLVSVFGITLIPMIFTAGFLTDQYGARPILLGGSVLLACALAFLAMASNYAMALISVILLSTGWSMVINSGNTLMLPAFPDAGVSFATNFPNVFFGLGAFLTPLVAAALIRSLGLPPTLGVLSLFCLLPGVLILGTGNVGGAGAAAVDLSGMFRDPILWLCGVALLFYSPLEASLGAWTTTYLGEQGYREQGASGLLSGFWLTFMATRLLTAFLLPKNSEHLYLVALSVASIAVLCAMVFGRGRSLSGLVVILCGAIFGPIFPTLLAIFLGHFHPSLHGRAVGVLFAIGGVGWAVFPMLLGAAAGRYGVRRAFGVAIAAAIGLTITSLLISGSTKGETPATPTEVAVATR